MNHSITSPPPGSPSYILAYLQHSLPGYPYDPDTDHDFIDELIDDFPDCNVLEEIKTFRWFHDNQPTNRVRNLRLAIRRWIARGSDYSCR